MESLTSLGSAVGALLTERRQTLAVAGPVEAVMTLETGSDAREANMWLFARRAVELLESCMRKAKS